MTSDIHRIFVCTSCRRGSGHPGEVLIGKLRTVLDLAGGAGRGGFDIAGVACMAGCDQPCTVAYSAPGKATYLFGDIDPQTDVDDLTAFAELYRGLEDGWCRAASRPGKLRHAALARVPALIAGDTGGSALR